MYLNNIFHNNLYNNLYNNLDKYNYYNIIPILLLNILVILLFEGILFFIYLLSTQTTLINDIIYEEKHNLLNKNIQKNPDVDANIYNGLIDNNNLNNININLLTDGEKNNINKQKTIGILLYITLLVGIIILLYIYVYIVKKKYYKNINWGLVIVTVVITSILIIIIESFYVAFIMFNKKFNKTILENALIDAINE